MAELQVSLSGVPSFSWRGEEVTVESRKPLAMLCYLCLCGSSNREELAELLWGSGRLLNVRQALYQLRQLPGASEWLSVSETVTVQANSDVRRFEQALSSHAYEQALEEWEPQLLSSLLVPKAPAFKEWLELERSRLEGLYLTALEQRASELEREGAFEGALELVNRYLAIDPLRETGHRSAIRLLYLLGEPESAINQYRTCQKILRAELESEPLPATTALVEAVARGDPLSVSVAPRHLPPRLRHLLQALAINGGRGDVPLLAAVLDKSEYEIAEGITELEQRRLVEAGGYVPPDIVDDALTNLSGSFARLLYRNFAQAFEELAAAGNEATIGWHWLGALEPERAAPWLLAALRRKVLGTDDEDVELLGFQLLWCGDARHRFEAAMLLEAFCERKGDGELQDDLLGEAGSLAWELQDDNALIRLELRRARRLLRLNLPGEALPVAQEALSSARRVGGELLLAQALSTMGVVLFHLGQLDEARGYFEENSRSSLPDERYRSLNNLGAIAGLRGDLAGSYDYLEEALTLAREQGNVDDIAGCLNNLAATAERMAAYPRASERFREARGLAQRTGNARNAAQHLLNLAEVYGKQGSLGPAWNTALEALEEGDELADARIQGQALEQLGQIARHAGLFHEAHEHFRRAEEKYTVVGDERKVAHASCNVALAEFLLGEAAGDSVVARLEVLCELGLSENARWFWLELALAAQEAQLAREWLERAQAGANNPHLRVCLAIARLRAALLDGTQVANMADELRQVLEELAFVEAPVGHLLLWAALRPGDEADYHRRMARKLVDEQGAGLPRKLRSSLAALPGRWCAALGF